MAPSTVGTFTNTTTRITRLRLRHTTTTPPATSKPGHQTRERGQSTVKATYTGDSSPLSDVDEATNIRVASGDTKAGAATLVDGLEVEMRDIIEVAGAEQEAEQEAISTRTTTTTTRTTPPPKQKINLRTSPKSTGITKTATTITITKTTPTKPSQPTTTTAVPTGPAKPTARARTRLRTTPPRTSNQGNIIKTSRPAANDVFLNGKRLNLLYDDGFQQMRDFWEDFGRCIDAGGEFLD